MPRALGHGLPESPLDAAKKVMPAHRLGGALTKGDELAGNIEAGKIAQSKATVHPRQEGITGKGIGRHGRKGRAR